MARVKSGSFLNLVIVSLALLAFASYSHAVDPTTSAAATVNGSAYNFGSWTNVRPVVAILACNPGSSSCYGTSYCIDAANTCNPTAPGTQYAGPINVSGEGITYLRYASNNSSGGWGDVSSVEIMIDTTAPGIAISEDASGSWTNNDTISVSADPGNGSSIAQVKWVARPDSACGPAQDNDLNSGNSGATMHADSDSTFQNRYICFRATDSAGNSNYTSSSQITKLDTTAPVVDVGSGRTANGQFTTSVAVSDSGSGVATYSWAEVSGPGTIAFGSAGSKDTTISASADGTYVIALTATDNALNSANDSFSLVWETTAPTISISNPNATAAKYKVLSASASKGVLAMSVTTGSVCDATLTFQNYAAISFTGEADNGKRVCYKATDDAGNTAYQLSNAIAGIDTTKPILALVGSQNTTIEVHGNYTDAGATASDNHDGDITSNIAVNGSVNKDAVGTYTLTYDVADAAGNKAVQVARTVNVIDTTSPIITLNGNSTLKIELHSNYSDAGATATDNYDGDITSRMLVNNGVNTGATGTYNVTYDVSDAAGNRAAQIVRTVLVVDSLGSALLLIGALIVVALAGAGAYIAFFRKKKGLG